MKWQNRSLRHPFCRPKILRRRSKPWAMSTSPQRNVRHEKSRRLYGEKTMPTEYSDIQFKLSRTDKVANTRNFHVEREAKYVEQDKQIVSLRVWSSRINIATRVIWATSTENSLAYSLCHMWKVLSHLLSAAILKTQSTKIPKAPDPFPQTSRNFGQLNSDEQFDCWPSNGGKHDDHGGPGRRVYASSKVHSSFNRRSISDEIQWIQFEDCVCIPRVQSNAFCERLRNFPSTKRKMENCIFACYELNLFQTFRQAVTGSRSMIRCSRFGFRRFHDRKLLIMLLIAHFY